MPYGIFFEMKQRITSFHKIRISKSTKKKKKKVNKKIVRDKQFHAYPLEAKLKFWRSVGRTRRPRIRNDGTDIWRLYSRHKTAGMRGPAGVRRRRRRHRAPRAAIVSRESKGEGGEAGKGPTPADTHEGVASAPSGPQTKLITTEFQVFPFFPVARLSKLCIRNSVRCNCTFSYLHFESFVGNISYIRQKIRIKETKLCMRCNRNFKRQE